MRSSVQRALVLAGITLLAHAATAVTAAAQQLAPQFAPAARAVILDAQGVIRWSYVSPIGVNPGADGILDALEDLRKRGS